VTLVVGAGALPAALFLARMMSRSSSSIRPARVEAAESRAVSEQLGARSSVVGSRAWLPDVTIDLAVLDAAALAATTSRHRRALVGDLQVRTRSCGVHVMLPTPETPDVIRLEPESLESLYRGWTSNGPRRATAAPSLRPRSSVASTQRERVD